MTEPRKPRKGGLLRGPSKEDKNKGCGAVMHSHGLPGSVRGACFLSASSRARLAAGHSFCVS